MKRRIAALAAVGAVGLWLTAQQMTPPRPLASVMPAGALLYVEAKNLAGLVGEWDASSRRTQWLASPQYQLFSRSRLFLRLQNVFNEYAASTGAPPDANLLRSVAGGESALAVYDVNKMEFLYVTRLPSPRAMESLLWKQREKFSTRQSGGVSYYVKTDAGSGRTAAFAVAGDLLLVATREAALGGALALLGNGQGPSVRSEAWHQAATAAGGAPGEIRMVTSLARLAATPGFRSYWIQRNGPELRKFQASVTDFHRTAGEVREERVLLRTTPASAPDAAAIGGVLGMVPANSGYYRAWPAPEPEQVAEVLRQKVLSPGPSMFEGAGKFSPPGSIEAAAVGAAWDLETKLDEAPAAADHAAYRPEALRRLLTGVELRAALVVQSGRTLPDGVFAGSDAAVALEAKSPWNAEAVRAALAASVEELYTTRNIGLNWKEDNGVWAADGLARLAMAMRGPVLIVGTDAALVRAVRDRNVPDTAPATYAAGAAVSAEAPHYDRMMRLIDQTGMTEPGAEPMFFSDGLSSLVRTLLRMEGFTVREVDTGAAVKQTVVYRVGP